MRWLGLLMLLLAGAVGLLGAADEKKPDDPVQGFLVHEWGVWRVHNDVHAANADMRATWDELPAFVYGQTTTRDFPRHWEEAKLVKKPVIFFHAPRAMEAEVRVDFPSGVPAVWWPATENPAYFQDEFRGRNTTPDRPVKYLQWKLQLKESLWKNRQLPERKPLSKTHWMNTLREVKCDEVYAPVGQRNFGLEREKFVYYDGLLPHGDTVSIKIEKEHVSLNNQAKTAIFDVWVIDNRDATKPRVGRLPRLDGSETKDVDLTAQKGERWAEDAGKALTAQLKDAGLNEDEGAALTTIWSDEFFHSEGVTLLYRLPQEEYDRLLPLTVKPRPEKIVRVGLVQQVSCDPALAERVARLVKQLDDDEFEKREAAQRELTKIGRAAFGPLLRLKPTITAPEAKRRIEELLEKNDAQRALKN
jgi:hypothetical protein